MIKNLSANLEKLINHDAILIVLAGSRQSTEYSKNSDYDYFILTENTDKTVIYKNYEGDRVELFFYSLERFENCIKSNDHIVIDVFTTGTPIFKRNKEADNLLTRVKKMYDDYKIESETALRFQYRFEMIEDKLKDNDDEITIRWLSIYATPYIIRYLYYLNGKVGPSLKNWPQKILECNQLPDNFKDRLEILLGKKYAKKSMLKNNLLEILNYIKGHLGQPPDFYEIPTEKHDQTNII